MVQFKVQQIPEPSEPVRTPKLLMFLLAKLQELQLQVTVVFK
jgi:hypothetical protein